MITENGLIGKSGKWYPCKQQEHVETWIKNEHDEPFVECKKGSYAFFENTFLDCKPTKAQFETLMIWCTEMEEKFEDVIDHNTEPWIDFLG